MESATRTVLKSVRNQGATPLAFEALLLFAAPEVLTLQKLVELLTLGEHSHQLQAVTVYNLECFVPLFV